MERALRVFIAEDEPLVMQGLKIMVRSAGFEIADSAIDGIEAEKKLKKADADVAIMDINMPGKDGLSVIESVNGQVRFPFVIITAYKDEELLSRAMDIGVFAYLPKPIDDFELKTTIEIARARFEEFKELETELGNTKQALSDRKELEKAKGIVMEQMNLSESNAMKHIQKLARDNNKKLIEISREIINASNLFKA